MWAHSPLTRRARSLELRASPQSKRCLPKAPEVANLRDRGAAEAIVGDVLGRIACPILKVHVQDVDLGWFEPGDANVEPFLDQKFGQWCTPDRQLFPVPAGALGDAVVGQHKGSLFCLAQPLNNDGRNRRHAERSGSFQSAVPRDENVIFIHEYGCRKPKLADAGGNLSNLLLRMGTGVFGVRPDLLNRQVCVPVRHGDWCARRSTRVNADEPAKKPNGKSSHMLTSDNRTPKLPTIWFRSASAVSEFGHPPEASDLRVAAPNCSGQVLLR